MMGLQDLLEQLESLGSQVVLEQLDQQARLALGV